MLPLSDPGVKLVETPNGVHLEITIEKAWTEENSQPLVTTDLLGKANQTLAAHAQDVYVMVAGLAVELKALAVPRGGPTDGT